MHTRLASRLLVIPLLLFAVGAGAEDGSFILTLQVRGSHRPVQLETHAGQLLDRARIERDVRRLWATGHFDDIRVEAAETPAGTHLVFRLVDKPRLYLRRVEFTPSAERRPLGLTPGMPVDMRLAWEVAAALRRQLKAEGHAEARVEAEPVPVGFQEADLHLRVEPGPAYQVEEVRFTGNLGVEQEQLQRALRSTRGRRLLPGLPGLWRGWLLLAPFSEQAIEAELQRLRSFYLSRGYFHARVGLGGVEFEEDKATVTIAVESGPRYHVRDVALLGAEGSEELAPRLDGHFPARELCHCLLAARRKAETAGALDFAARLEIESAGQPPWAGLPTEFGRKPLDSPEAEPWVVLTATVNSGPSYTVGRIEFLGHHSFSETTLRRAWNLHEGDLFDAGKLRRSLARLNRMGFFEPVREANVLVQPDPKRRRVNLTVRLKEKPRGRWFLSGPLGGTGLGGPLQLSLASRLPAWGRGPLQLSTYYGTVGILAFSQPVFRALSLVPRTRLLPLVSLERPYLPGQEWQSGFVVGPGLGWQGILATYGLLHARNAALNALASDPANTSGLAVPVTWRADQEKSEVGDSRPAGLLSCRTRKPHWAWLRAAGAMAVNLLLTTPLL